MRKDRIRNSLFARAASPLLAASLVGALVAASPAADILTPAAAQGAGRGAPQSPAKFTRVRVTAEEIARLPRGESYVVRVGAGAGGAAAGYGGRTTVNQGVLNSKQEGGASGLTKAGAGTLTLSGANNAPAARPGEAGGLADRPAAVYEFRSERPIDFGRVVVQAGPDAAPVPLEAWLRARLPARAMRKWPFKRLLIGPARGVAQIEGWKIDADPPGADYQCEDDYCSCNGTLDCVKLILNGACGGEWTCADGECFCDR